MNHRIQRNLRTFNPRNLQNFLGRIFVELGKCACRIWTFGFSAESRWIWNFPRNLVFRLLGDPQQNLLTCQLPVNAERLQKLAAFGFRQGLYGYRVRIVKVKKCIDRFVNVRFVSPNADVLFLPKCTPKATLAPKTTTKITPRISARIIQRFCTNTPFGRFSAFALEGSAVP